MTNKKSLKLDQTDIRIVSTLDSLPPRSSTDKIGEELGIPPRSIRYRLSKLKEKNYLKEKSLITHERKLGLRESFMVLAENPTYRETLLQIIEENPALSWYVPTSGKYQGFIVHSINAMNVPNYPLEILRLLKDKGLIYDYYQFEITDYVELGWNYSYFDSEGNWNWDWNIWYEGIQEGFENLEPIVFDENPELTSFDNLDIQILKNLILFEDMTQKGLGEKLKLSESQISRRIRALEQKGIIRGHRTGFQPFTDTYVILVLFKLKDSQKKILNILNQIPYPKAIAFEKQNSISMGFEIPSDELLAFLNGLHYLQALTESQFIQFQLSAPTFNVEVSFDLFDEENNDLNRIVKEYENTILRIKSL